jgi:purine-binding chemotaxis protein CheW
MADDGTTAAVRRPAEQHREVLRRRAAALARVHRRERGVDLASAVVFSLGQTRFGINAACVLEAAVLRELTPLPGAPAPLFGVTHWRGSVLTLLDLRGALGVQPRGLTELGRILVLDGPDRLFAIVADAVQDIIEVDVQLLARLPDDEAGTGLLRGITADGVLYVDEQALLHRYGSAQEPSTNTGMRRVT